MEMNSKPFVVALDGEIAGMKIPCNGDCDEGFFVPVSVPLDDPIFISGKVCPVSEAIGIPLLMRRAPSEASKNYPRGKLDNQKATYLVVEKQSGVALPEWQQNVGTVLIVRKDKKPLYANHLEAFWMFNDLILDKFGDCEDRARAMMNEAAFKRFWENYKKSEATNPREDEECWVNWTDIVSPFEV